MTAATVTDRPNHPHTKKLGARELRLSLVSLLSRTRTPAAAAATAAVTAVTAAPQPTPIVRTTATTTALTAPTAPPHRPRYRDDRDDRGVRDDRDRDGRDSGDDSSCVRHHRHRRRCRGGERRRRRCRSDSCRRRRNTRGGRPTPPPLPVPAGNEKDMHAREVPPSGHETQPPCGWDGWGRGGNLGRTDPAPRPHNKGAPGGEGMVSEKWHRGGDSGPGERAEGAWRPGSGSGWWSG